MAKSSKKSTAGGTVDVGGTKVPVILIAAAAGIGLILFLFSRKETGSGETVLGADQTAADLNNLSEMEGRVNAGLLSLDDLIRRFNDSLEAAEPEPTIDTTPVVKPPTDPGYTTMPVQTTWTPPPAPVLVTPANPIKPADVATPGVDYDPNGLGALIADVSGPIQIGNGKYIVTENWTLSGLPAAFDPFGADPTPVVITPPTVSRPPAIAVAKPPATRG